MELTYNEALDTIIEHTEIGYTVASQDRLWVVFIFDLWSDGEEWQFRYNRLYSRGLRNGWAYDLTINEVKVWTSRREAEAFAEQLRQRLEEEGQIKDPDPDFDGVPEVYVMNLGDDARYEALIIGRDNGRGTRGKPKFKGSQRAWDAQIEMSRKWLAENS